ncbi:unnamed protein product [Blepharisma stoltei]|uniref:Uncharacterized protein n=1 Tax=Blepharisma stoltei TaxID=1481888 RepID=A0AAU9JUJ2_9CILI|nr:unnamed protein product [Blepharisma stoltei]
MGKSNNQINKQHRKSKEKKEKKKRSKEEHFKRKHKEEEKKKAEKFEAERYDLDDFAYKKLLKNISELLTYSQETKEAIPQLFSMLDSGHEVDLTDIEDGFVREHLEKIMEIFEKQVTKTEDEDGRFVYVRSGKKSLENQIKLYIENSSSDSKREQWMTSMSSSLETAYNLPVPKAKKPEPEENQEEIRSFMHKYDHENRPKSLMELHQEKHGISQDSNTDQYLYGHKTLDKRFGKGKFYTSFS